MPQNEYIEEHQKRHGKRFDHEERTRKKKAREAHINSRFSQKVSGLRAKLYHQKCRVAKIKLKKQLREYDSHRTSRKVQDDPSLHGAVPPYLLDRTHEQNAKQISSSIKEKRKDHSIKYSVPLPKVRGIAEDEMFKVIHTGSRKKKAWKRMITKATFVGDEFTRRPVKYERFIRPMALRQKKANVTHQDLAVTVQLPILSVKKNPQNPMYTQLGVLTKGTVIEVNVSELGLVTASGKVVWGKYAQVTNNPELDGCVNAVLLT